MNHRSKLEIKIDALLSKRIPLLVNLVLPKLAKQEDRKDLSKPIKMLKNFAVAFNSHSFAVSMHKSITNTCRGRLFRSANIVA